MANTTQVGLVITADGKLAVQEIGKVDKALGGTGKTAKQAESFSKDFISTLKLIAPVAIGAFSGAAVSRFVTEVARATDQVRMIQLQAEKLSGGAVGFDAIYEQAKRLGVSLEDAGQQMNYFAPALGKLGLGFQQSAAFAADLTRAMRVYGVQGQAAASVTTQLGQALSSGTLSGDELKSLRENAGGLALELEQAIQQALGTTKSLKDLGSEGALSAQVVYDAWQEVFGSMRSDMEAMPQTLEQQTGRMRNAATKLFSTIGEALASNDIINEFINGWIDGVEYLSELIGGPTGLGSFGSFSKDIATVDKQLAELAKKASQFEEAINSAWNSSSRSLAGRQLAGVIREMDELADKRRIYIQMAADERDIIRQGVAAHNDLSNTLGKEGDAADKAAAALGSYVREGLGGSADRIRELMPLFDEAERLTGLPKEIAIAVAGIESNFSDLATSTAGAKGMMQFMDSTLAGVVVRMREAGVATISVSDAQTQANAAILAGSFHLQELIEKYGNLKDALIAYNAGPGKVGTPFEKLPQETQDYVNRVLPAIQAMTRAEDGATAAAKIMGDTTVKAFREIGATEPKLRDLEEVIQALVEQYIPAERHAREYAEAEAALSVAVATSTISQERATQVLAAMRAEMDAAGQAATDMGMKIPTVAELWSESLMEMSRSIQNTLGDAFKDLFDGTIKNAKDFMSRLGDVILSALSDIAAALLMRPINVLINGVLGTTTMMGSGSASAIGMTGASGGGGTGLTGMGSLGNLTTGTSIGTTMGMGAEYLGAYQTGANLSLIPNWAFGAGAIGGAFLGSMLFEGEYVSIGSSIGATIGAAAGASMAAYFAAAGSVFGPIGTVVGGLLGGIFGGALGSMFGGGGDTVAAYVDLKGGQFEGVRAEGLSEQQIQAMLAEIDSYNLLISTVAEMLGPEAQAIMEGWNREGGPQGLDPAQFDAWLEQGAGSIIQAMVDWAPGLFGEMVQELWAASGGDMAAFAAGVAQLRAFYDALPAMVESLTAAGLNLGEDAERTALYLMNAAGGYDNLIAMHSKYLDFVLSDEEKLAQGQELLTDAFDKLGLTLPTTRDELEALVGGLDLTTEEGRAAYVAIMGMFDALQQYIVASEAAAEATASLVASFEQMIYSAAEVTRIEMDRAATEANAIAGPALGIDITTMDRAGFAAWVESMGGIEAVMDLLGDGSQAFIDAATTYFGISEQFAASSAATAASFEALIYSEAQLTAMQIARSGAEADAISMQLWGIEVSEMSREEFAAWVESMGGMDVVLANLGDSADAFIASFGSFLAGTEQAAAAAAQAATPSWTPSAANGPAPFPGAGRYGASLAGLTDAIGQWLPVAAETATAAVGSLADSILDWVQRMRGEVVEMMAPRSLDITKSQFDEQLALAQAGDQEALGSITSYADAYLAAARQQSISRGSYEEVAGYVTARVEALTTPGAGADDPQVDELQRLRAEQAAANVQLISLTSRMSSFLSMLERWEAIGLPETRTA